VALQDPAQLNIVYVMPHIDSISEGTSLTATVSILDAKSSQTYSGNIYIELRDPDTMALVASYGPYYVPGSGTITINAQNTKRYALAIYAAPASPGNTLLVPLPAVYPPRA
jgi:hypothetical protein